MTIKVGDKMPSVTLQHMTADGVADITTDEIFGGKRVALFALPGAFTPTCSAKHLPSRRDGSSQSDNALAWPSGSRGEIVTACAYDNRLGYNQ